MPNTRDRVEMYHPDDPDSFCSVPRSTFENSYSKNGWKESKSPATKAAVVTNRPPKVDAPTASKEG